jgi:hypothetical protein
MNITGIRDDAYRLLDINSGTTVSDDVEAEVVNSLNRGLQTMSLSGKDYFLAEPLTQAVVSGTAEYLLDYGVQRIVGPMRLQGGHHLRELRSKGQYEGFNAYFSGGLTMGPVSGTPLAYFLETERAPALTVAEATGNIVVAGAGGSTLNGIYIPVGNYFAKSTGPGINIERMTVGDVTGWAIITRNSFTPSVYYYAAATISQIPSDGLTWQVYSGATAPAPTVTAEMTTPSGQADAAKISLCLAPTPNANATLEFDAILEPTEYSAADLSDSAVSVPVAHKYVEEILLPLVRYFLTRSRFFTNADKLPMLEADYKAAMDSMGLGEPVQNVTRKTNPQLEEAA